jgi:tetratricopeptide (TPR) repeat protein
MGERDVDRGASAATHALLARARDVAARDPPAALALLQNAPDEGDGLLHHARSALLLRLGRADDAVAAAERAVALLPDVPDVAANLGTALLHRVRGLDGAPAREAARRARDLLAGVVAAGPRFPEAGASLALACELAGDAQAALAAADENLRRFPDDVGTHFNRASALKALGRIDDAVSVLRALVARHPAFAPAHEALQRLAR